MLKWLLFIVVVAIAVFWIKRNRQKDLFSEPEAKKVELKRYYVTPPKPEDKPADDNQNGRY